MSELLGSEGARPYSRIPHYPIRASSASISSVIYLAISWCF